MFHSGELHDVRGMGGIGMNILEARRRTLVKGVYKKTVEGNPAIAQGSLARRYPGITMQGWTEQAQYEGKNLFDKTKIEDRIDTTHTQTDTGIEVSGLYYVTYRVSVAPNTDMRISYNKSGNGINQVAVYGTDLSPDNLISSSYGTGMEFNTGKHTEILVLFYCSGGTEDVSIYNDVMLNLGSTSLPYEPYTGGQPSPNPDYPQEIISAGKYDEETQKWKYEVKLTGKNLIPTYSEYSDWMSGDYRYIPVTGFVIGETYTFSQSVVPELGEGFYVALGTVAGTVNTGTVYWIYHSTVQNLCVKSITFVATQETYYLNAAGFGSPNMSRFLSVFPDLMVELGTERTEYEPYKEQTVTLTSDRPLTKWDRLEKRNGQWGWVYKSEEIESYTDESVPGEYFSTTGRLSTGAQVWYETTTETFVPLSESEQEAMNELYTFRPTTVLSNDCECNMTLTYKTKKSMQSAPGGGYKEA